ncbi:MAG: hypothetical protein Q9170_000036 [Blastenia crenularia]
MDTGIISNTTEHTSSIQPAPGTEPLPKTGPVPITERPLSAELPLVTEPLRSPGLAPGIEAPASAEKRKQTTRDQRLQIQTLRKAGHDIEFIVNFFKPVKVTWGQVYYALKQPIDPQTHKRGPKPMLDETTRHRIKEVMSQSTGDRPKTYREAAKELQLDVSENTIARALAKEGQCLDLLSTVLLISVGYNRMDHYRISKGSSKRNHPKRPDCGKNGKAAAVKGVLSDNSPSTHAHSPIDVMTSWPSSPENFTNNDLSQPMEPSLTDVPAQTTYNNFLSS